MTASCRGVVPRAKIADDVKNLDQDARGLLRKHGVRFGQFTVFMPALLKPAPTRLRLILSSLFEGAEEFPSAPPPGLVTIPVMEGATAEFYARSGYRRSGSRAIRIDMLERLADMIRGEDTRSGFEAKADMLSITGLTLEQFADLMQGLGYKGERGERPKQRAASEPAKPAADSEPLETTDDSSPLTGAEVATDRASDAPIDLPALPETPAQEAPLTDDAAAPEGSDDSQSEPEDKGPDADDQIEIFYTFTWEGRKSTRPRKGTGGKPQAKGARGNGPRHGKGSKSGKGSKGGGPRHTEARPPRKDKPVDPDNPFAALMALKEKS